MTLDKGINKHTYKMRLVGIKIDINKHSHNQLYV